MNVDHSKTLQSQVLNSINEKQSLCIRAGNSKHFYGNATDGKNSPQLLDLNNHQGILNYQASELVLTARAGTCIDELNNALQTNNQCLPFEPPRFSDKATLGGTIACGISGSARPFRGSVRDAVLGCKMINGQGEIVRFGGEVVKNVAGYDVSRLMTGALGTLGVLLEVSIKVQPIAPHEITIVQDCTTANVIRTINTLRRGTLPLSAIVHLDNQLYIRLSGTLGSLESAKKSLGDKTIEHSSTFWQSINEQTHDFFRTKQNLWRIVIPPATNDASLIETSLMDWAGGLYWFYSDKSAEEIRSQVKKLNGHATLFRSQPEDNGHSNNKHSNTSSIQRFSPLTPDMLILHKKIKQAFDPHGIFNIGKMYPDF